MRVLDALLLTKYVFKDGECKTAVSSKRMQTYILWSLDLEQLRTGSVTQKASLSKDWPLLLSPQDFLTFDYFPSALGWYEAAVIITDLSVLVQQCQICTMLRMNQVGPSWTMRDFAV